MTEVGFYQLSRRPIEAVVPLLVAKARAAGLRLLLRSDDAALLALLDERLWAYQPSSFLPHGSAASLPPERVASQPVLLDCAFPAANAADCLMQLGGDIPDALTDLARVLYLFGEAELDVARARWRLIRQNETLRATYWRETDEGRFEKAA